MIDGGQTGARAQLSSTIMHRLTSALERYAHMLVDPCVCFMIRFVICLQTRAFSLPIRSISETIHDSFAHHAFPRFELASYIYFNFLLVYWIVCVL